MNIEKPESKLLHMARHKQTFLVGNDYIAAYACMHSTACQNQILPKCVSVRLKLVAMSKQPEFTQSEFPAERRWFIGILPQHVLQMQVWTCWLVSLLQVVPEVLVNALQMRDGEVACVAHSLTWYLANLLANSFSPLSTPAY